MQKQNTNMSETKQTLYIGIDEHKKDLMVAFRSKSVGLDTKRFDPDSQTLVNYMRRTYPNHNYESVYEAGFGGFWLDRELRAAGVKNIVVNPADVATKGKEKAQKSDKKDAQKLARELASGNLEEIFIPSVEDEAIRTVTRLREQTVKDQTRVKNRIKSLLCLYNVDLPRNDEMQHWSGNFIKYLSELKGLPVETKYTLDTHITILMFIRTQLLQIIRKMRQLVKDNKALKAKIEHLSSIPGVGFITAAGLQTELIDIERFPSLDNLASFVGLSPAVYSSGEYSKDLGITKRYKKYLRNRLIESAWMAVRYDPELRGNYEEYVKRMSKQKAIIRIAKKLLNRVMYVMRNNVDYKPKTAKDKTPKEPVTKLMEKKRIKLKRVF